jgi:hypothetical protein
MRLFVLALLVANAAFFTWRYNEALEARLAAARDAPRPLPPNTPSLTLVSELDELPPRRLPPAPATPVPPTETAASESSQAAPPADSFAGDAAPAMSAEPVASTGPEQQAEAGDPSSLPAIEAGQTAPPPTVTGLAVTPTAPEPALPATPEPVPPAATGTPSGVCVRIGPFTGSAEYGPLLGWLSPRSASVNVETVTTARRQLFWVYLEQKSADEAQQKLAELARKGVRDTLLVNREGVTNAISLGVFSTQEAVNRRLAEVARKGYSPLVVPRVETTDLRWLNAELASGYADKTLIPAELRGNAGVEDIDCAALAGRPPG